MVSERMHINAFIADDPVACVAIGTGTYLEHLAVNPDFRAKTREAR
jgi:actin-like ATPase involved in cell morphogenesis